METSITIFPDFNKNERTYETPDGLFLVIKYSTHVRKQNEKGLWYLTKVVRECEVILNTYKRKSIPELQKELLHMFLADVYNTILFYKYIDIVDRFERPMNFIDSDQRSEEERIFGIKYIKTK